MLVCCLCFEPLTLTPWGPVAMSALGSGPCRPIDAEIADADDDGLHVAVTIKEASHV